MKQSRVGTGKERYNRGSRWKRVVLKTEAFNSPETLDREDRILSGCEGYENQI